MKLLALLAFYPLALIAAVGARADNLQARIGTRYGIGGYGRRAPEGYRVPGV